MIIEEENIRVQYESTAESPIVAGDVLPFPYRFTEKEQLNAVLLDGTKLIYKQDYTVGETSITLSVDVPIGETITIYRSTPLDQGSEFPQEAKFNSKKIEDALDKLTMQNQEQREALGRALKLPLTASTDLSDLALPNPDPNKSVKWNADGTALVNTDFDPDLALALTENFKNQAQQAAVEAENQKNAATEQATIATQQAGIATEKTTEVVQAKEEAVTTIKDTETNSLAKINSEFNKANEWFEKLNAIPYIPVGTILPTTGAIDESLGYQRYANGQLIANVSSQAPDLVKFLKFQEAHAPNLLCSETEWQTALTLSTLGQVGKYVWNKEEDSIRIPRIVNIQGMMDMNTVGNMIEAGLPGMVGELNAAFIAGRGNTKGTGVFAKTNTGSADYGGIGANANTTRFKLIYDASSSNPIYGNSDTVQEESILYPYVLQIATGVQYKTTVLNEIELNNPYSLLDYKYSEYELNNLSWLRSEGQYNSKAIYPAVYDLLLKIYNGTETKAGVSVKLSTETFTDYDFVLNTADETFRLPIKVKLASGKAVVGNGMALGTNFTNNRNTTSDHPVQISATDSNRLNLLYGMEVTGAKVAITTNPSLSGLELSDSDLYLYFYVGETVQNANLVNVGRIEEKLATIIPDNSSLIASYAMPSTRYVDLTLGASGTTYIAPANGYFYVNKMTSAGGQYVSCGNNVTGIDMVVDKPNTQSWCTILMPVLKGQSCWISYTAGGAVNAFRFYYAIGSESEV